MPTPPPEMPPIKVPWQIDHAFNRGWNDANGDKKMRNRPYNTDELCIAYERGYLEYFAERRSVK